MRWPWTKQPALEQRAESSYTDVLVSYLLAQSGGQTFAYASATGALEACAGLAARAFATAEVTAAPAITRALSPSCMALIGRALLRRGEIVFYIDTTGGMINLLPCQSHDVDGYPSPSSWEYRCTISGPERTYTYNRVPATSVVHITYARDPETPWRGIGPLQAAQLAGKLNAETSAALADESSGPRGSLLGVPIDGEDPTLAPLKASIRTLAGKLALLETGDWGGAASGGDVDLLPKRVGANPPAGLVEVFKLSREDVMAACGVNPSLFMDAQGTAQRESYRQFLFGTVAPLGKLVARELADKLGDAVDLDWAELRASDVSGRARAFQSMVGSGMEVDRAMALSGLMVNDD